MPITKQAKKKLRHDRKKAKTNATSRAKLRSIVKEYRKKPTKKSLQEVFSILDKSKKKKIVHANKTSRLKSRLSKLLVK